MMQTIPEWRVTVTFSNAPEVRFTVADNFSSNVLRKIADLNFGGAVTSILIQGAEREMPVPVWDVSVK